MNKFFIYLFLFVILSNCALVKKETIEKEKISRDLFKKIEPIQKELNTNIKINLNKISKKNQFINNNSNNSGNINFETIFENKSSIKFSRIDNFEINQIELIFTDDDEIIFFDGKGSVFKTNTNLKKIWKVNHYSKKEKKLNPILYFSQNGKNLFIADTLSKIYSINLNNGELVWSKNSISPFNSNIKIYKDRFMTVDFENVIRCFSIRNGEELWNFKTENSFIKSQKNLSLILNQEIVYFINNLGDITALNVNDGSLIWQTPTQSNMIYQNAFSLKNSDLVFSNNSIYFSNNKNEIFSIDARNGIVKWKQTVNSSLRPTITANFVFSISEEGYLFVLDVRTGSIVKIINALANIKNKKNKIKPTGFILAKHKIYLSLNNGKLIKVDISSGIQENIFKIARSKISRPFVFNNEIYLIKENAIIKYN